MKNLTDDQRRALQSFRFTWHEKVLRDTEIPNYAKAVAGVVFHAREIQYRPVPLAIRYIALKAGISPEMARRGLERLRERCWIGIRIGQSRMDPRRICLSGGPEDLDPFSHHNDEDQEEAA